MAAFRKTQIPYNRDAGKYETIGFISQVMGGVGFHFLNIDLVSVNIFLNSVIDLLFSSLRYMCVLQWFSTALSINISSRENH